MRELQLAEILGNKRAWLFDLDGTLVDSAPAHRAAFHAALAELAPEALDEFRYRPGVATLELMNELVSCELSL